MSFVLSKAYRSQVLRVFRRASFVEKLEMIFLGFIHTCFAFLIGVMAAGLILLLLSAFAGIYREVRALF